MSKENKFIYLAFLIAFGISATIGGLYSSLASDEAFYLNVANDFLDGLGYTGGTIAPVYPALVSIFYTPLRIEFFAKLVNPLLISITLVSIFYFGKEFFDKKVAVMSALFFLTLPIAVTLSNRLLPDVAFNAFFVLSTIFFIRGVEKNSKNFLLSAIFAVVAFFTRYAAVLLIPIFVIYLLVRRRVLHKIFSDKLFYISLALAITFFVLISQLTFGLKIENYTGSLSAYTNTTTEETSSFYMTTFPLVPLALAPFLILGSYIGIKKRNPILLMFLLAIIFLIIFRTVFLPVREFRYMIDTSFFVVLLSAVGFEAFYKKLAKKSAVFNLIFVLLLIVNFVAGFYLVNTLINNPRYIEVKEASVWLGINCKSPVITNAGRHVRYYTGFNILENSVDNLKFNKDAECILYSEYEPALDTAIKELKNKTEIHRVGRVVVYRN